MDKNTSRNLYELFYQKFGEKEHREGFEEGVNLGVQTGMERMKEQFIKIGRKEAQENIVRKLINDDFSDEKITELTDLDLEEVINIREEQNH